MTNTPSSRGQSMHQRRFQQKTKPSSLSDWKQGKIITKDPNEADRKQTAPGHLPKWILLQDWMLQYWQDLPHVWGISVACRKPTTPRRKAYVWNNQGFSRGQELSDWLGFQPRRTKGLGRDGCVLILITKGFLFNKEGIPILMHRQVIPKLFIYGWNTVKIKKTPTR